MIAVLRPAAVRNIKRIVFSSLAADEKEKHANVQLPKPQLPDQLQKSLERVLSNHPRKSLIADGQALMTFLDRRSPIESTDSRKLAGFVAGKLADGPIRYGKRETSAFAASRVEASYGTALRVLKEIADRDFDFQPKTLLDFGSGVGTVPWAANEIWHDSIYEYMTIDVSNDMVELASSLRRGGEETTEYTLNTSPPEAVKGVYFKRYLPMSDQISYDVIVAAYSLSELPSLWKLREVVASLWKKTNHYIVLIEQGNKRGFDVISKARDYILQNNTKGTDDTLTGHVVSPCPHDLECPISTQGRFPCHFAQNVPLSFAQLNTALRRKGFYTEHFSYVVIKKGPRPNEVGVVPSRLLLPVRMRTRHVICRVCSHEGKACEVTLTKTKDTELYRRARKMRWGDRICITDEQLNRNSTRVVIGNNQSNEK